MTRRRRIVLALAVAGLCVGGTAGATAWAEYYSEYVSHREPPPFPPMCFPGRVVMQTGATATLRGEPVLRVHRGQDVTVDLVEQPPPASSQGQEAVLFDVTVELSKRSHYDAVHSISPPPPPSIPSKVSTAEFQPHVDLGRIREPGRYRVFVEYRARFSSGVCAKTTSGSSGLIGFVVVR